MKWNMFFVMIIHYNQPEKKYNNKNMRQNIQDQNIYIYIYMKTR